MSTTDALCQQIAAALDITLDELKSVSEAQERASELQEIADLLSAFQQLPDQAARRHCISYVEAEVHRSKSTSSEAGSSSALKTP